MRREHVLFFDTETTGVPIRGIPETDPYQPWMLQIAGRLMTGPDEVVGSLDLIVRPPPEAMFHEDALSKHGLSRGVVDAFGVPPSVAVEAFMELVDEADLIVAHNAGFDVRVVSREVERLTGTPWVVPSTPIACTMASAMGVAPAPPSVRMLEKGNDSPRPTRLEDLHEKLLGWRFEGAHSALADVDACARVFWTMVERWPGSIVLWSGESS